MLDIGFNRFLSLAAVSLAWMVGLGLATAGLLAAVALGVYYFSEGMVGWGVLFVLGGIVFTSVFLLVIRLALETVAVLFRIAGSARTLVEQGRSTSPGGQPIYASTPIGHVEYGPRRH